MKRFTVVILCGVLSAVVLLARGTFVDKGNVYFFRTQADGKGGEKRVLVFHEASASKNKLGLFKIFNKYYPLLFHNVHTQVGLLKSFEMRFALRKGFDAQAYDYGLFFNADNKQKKHFVLLCTPHELRLIYEDDDGLSVKRMAYKEKHHNGENVLRVDFARGYTDVLLNRVRYRFPVTVRQRLDSTARLQLFFSSEKMFIRSVAFEGEGDERLFDDFSESVVVQAEERATIRIDGADDTRPLGP